MTEFYQTYRLSNGIRLIHRQTTSEVAHFGMIVHTGTRDEQDDEHGLAHFMEHMFFKGTRKRSPYQIISRLEDVGGEINAYTTKEETAIYASFLRRDYRKAVELIQDIFLHSTFPERERKKETEVILNEIQSYEDTPSELIFDHSDEILFPDHPIGRNILGSEQSLKRFTNGLVDRFRLENYSTEELVLCSVGNLEFAKLKKYVENYFGALSGYSRTRKRFAPQAQTGIVKQLERHTYQKHCVISGTAYSYSDKRRMGLHLLNNILGGPGMNSRLNMALREKRGFSYSAESNYTTYTDTGALNIYFSCDREKFNKCLDVTEKELTKLRDTLLSPRRINFARRQLLGQIAISSDIGEHLLLSMGKSYLLFDKVDSLEEIEQKLEAVTPVELREIANDVLDPSRLNYLMYE